MFYVDTRYSGKEKKKKAFYFSYLMTFYLWY